jgi:hypothetical protein
MPTGILAKDGGFETWCACAGTNRQGRRRWYGVEVEEPRGGEEVSQGHKLM